MCLSVCLHVRRLSVTRAGHVASYSYSFQVLVLEQGFAHPKGHWMDIRVCGRGMPTVGQMRGRACCAPSPAYAALRPLPEYPLMMLCCLAAAAPAPLAGLQALRRRHGRDNGAVRPLPEVHRPLRALRGALPLLRAGLRPHPQLQRPREQHPRRRQPPAAGGRAVRAVPGRPRGAERAVHV